MSHWHQCRRWWNRGYACPLGGAIDHEEDALDDDDDRRPRVTPASKKAQAVSRAGTVAFPRLVVQPMRVPIAASKRMESGFFGTPHGKGHYAYRNKYGVWVRPPDDPHEPTIRNVLEGRVSVPPVGPPPTPMPMPGGRPPVLPKPAPVPAVSGGVYQGPSRAIEWPPVVRPNPIALPVLATVAKVLAAQMRLPTRVPSYRYGPKEVSSKPSYRHAGVVWSPKQMGVVEDLGAAVTKDLSEYFEPSIPYTQNPGTGPVLPPIPLAGRKPTWTGGIPRPIRAGSYWGMSLQKLMNMPG